MPSYPGLAGASTALRHCQVHLDSLQMTDVLVFLNFHCRDGSGSHQESLESWTLRKDGMSQMLKGQGSVLSPLPFTLYTTPVSSLISGHCIPHHLYAGDRQLYVSFSSGDSAAALNGLQSCLASFHSWMSMNKQKLNPDKTEFLLTGNEQQRSKYRSMFPFELLV